MPPASTPASPRSTSNQLDAVLVLNPDCRLRPGSLAVLAGPSRRVRAAASLLPKLVNPDGTCSLRCAARRPSRRAAAEALLGGLAGRVRQRSAKWSRTPPTTSGPASGPGPPVRRCSCRPTHDRRRRAVGRVVPALQRGDRLRAASSRPGLVPLVRARPRSSSTSAANRHLNPRCWPRSSSRTACELFRRRHGPVLAAALLPGDLAGRDAARGRRTAAIATATVVALLHPSRRLSELPS